MGKISMRSHVAFMLEIRTSSRGDHFSDGRAIGPPHPHTRVHSQPLFEDGSQVSHSLARSISAALIQRLSIKVEELG